MTLSAPADPDLIGRIYEAAVLPDRWPNLLQAIADRAGSKGAAFIRHSPVGASLIVSPAIEQHTADYIAAGWLNDNTHAQALLSEQFPGFRTEADYRTPEEIAHMPVHAEFLDPRGFISGAATVLQGPADDLLHLSAEGFASHPAAAGALPFLNSLRPHLGRAASLAAQLQAERDQATVSALARAGVGAAVVGSDRRLRAANQRFVERVGNILDETRTGVRFADAFLDEQFRAAIEHPGVRAKVRSIGVSRAAGEAPFAIHVLPLIGAARERAESDGVLLLLAESGNASVPNADLLRLLFDLTPAEAMLARALIEGKTVAEFAKLRGLSDATVRSQVRSVFAKTGVTRQVELVRLLSGLGSPLDRSTP
jgi:DNA-binding CsgD family transcriptional regulator